MASLYAALRKTIKDFEDEKTAQYRLDFSEALLVHEIALTYTRLGQPGKAIVLLDGVVQNTDNLRTTTTENNILLPRFNLDLAELLVEATEYEMAVPVCENLLDMVRKTIAIAPRNTMFGLKAAYLLGVCYHKLGKPENEYMPLLTTAYHSAMSSRQNDLADKIRREYDVL